MLRESEPLAVEVTEAIRRGDDEAVRRLLDAHPSLACEHIQTAGGQASTLLHIIAGWPGFLPNGPAIAQTLIEAGADPNARATGGPFAGTPLHSVASNDDADVAAVLIDGGADLEISDGAFGTPLASAVGHGCWHVARLLVSRGARVEELWHAVALGMHERVIDLLPMSPTEEQLTEAFFLACGGGQRRTSELLLARGAKADAAPGHGQMPLEATCALDIQHELLVEWLRSHGAHPRDDS